eukprot:gene27741-33507_t
MRTELRILTLLWLLSLAEYCLASFADLTLTHARKLQSTQTPEQLEEQEFDWITYIDSNVDLQGGVFDKTGAWMHYNAFGRHEKRKYSRKYPSNRSLYKTEKKILDLLNLFQRRNVSLSERTLVIYLLPTLSGDRSMETMVNSVKLFSSAVLMDSGEETHNFYWINAIKATHNPYLPYFPQSAHNLVVADWAQPLPPQLLTLYTLELLYQHRITQQFGSVLFLDSDTRGPWGYRAGGQWVSVLRNLLFTGAAEVANVNDGLHHDPHNIGLAGPIVSCELTPHVQNFSFIMKSTLLDSFLAAFNTSLSFRHLRGVMKYNLQYFSVIVRKKYNISSLLYKQAGMEGGVWGGECLNPQTYSPIFLRQMTSSLPTTTSNNHQLPPALLPPSPSPANPLLWCSLNLTSLLFTPWGVDRGGGGNVNLELCESVKNQAYALMTAISIREGLDLMIPEAYQGGLLHDLYLQHEAEIFGREAGVTQVSAKRDTSWKLGSGEGVFDVNSMLRKIYLPPANITSRDGDISGLSTGAGGSVTGVRQAGGGGLAGTVDWGGRLRKGGQICLLVKSQAAWLDKVNSTEEVRDYFDTFHHHIRSLLRQSDPNWVAFYFLLDGGNIAGHGVRLKSLLDSYGDSRLQHLKLRARLPKSERDARGSSSSSSSSSLPPDPTYLTELALHRTLLSPHCAYLSITDARTIYGRDVISQVRRVGKDKDKENYRRTVGAASSLYQSHFTPPSQRRRLTVENATNALSRNDGEEVEETRLRILQSQAEATFQDTWKELIGVEQSVAPPVVIVPTDSHKPLYSVIRSRGEESLIHGPCVALIVTMQISVMGMAGIPPPELLSMPSVFLQRDYMLHQRVSIGNFTALASNLRLPSSSSSSSSSTSSPSQHSSPTPEQLYLSHLLAALPSRPHYLPLRSFSSLIFLAPSPLWCLGGGRVWLGHPHPDHARCYTQRALSLLALHDDPEHPKYEWNDGNRHLCLRYSAKGYAYFMHAGIV